MNKKKILICVDWYTPGFKAGGPIRSVNNMVHAFKKDFDFYILTSAYDLGDTKPYSDIMLNQWHDNQGVFIKYLDKTCLNYPTIKTNLIEVDPDILYLNSLFSKNFTLYPLRYARKLNKRIILAPRGMLGKGALDIKQSKKKVFLSVAKILGFYNNICWHASTSEEEYEVKTVFGKHSKVVIAQNIPLSQVYDLKEIKEKKPIDKISFVFLSRISKKKNLHLAIEAFKQINTNQNIDFEIYGLVEDKMYYDTFKSEIDQSNNRINIVYKGVVKPTEVNAIYARSNFMILPTMHENFGHTIVESWANGCPVIISQNTPWKNLKEKNIGWDVDINDETSLVKAINEAVSLNQGDYNDMVEASYSYFKGSVFDTSILMKHKALFED